MRQSHFPLLACLAFGAGSLLSTTVLAQGLGGSRGMGPAMPAPQAEKPSQPPPPALPGSHAEKSSPAPAEHPTADMPPNDALFDAINRGDLASARDAINRGADLNGRNVLGMTPLELSVDLGRNEISFLLLSLRGSGDAPASAEASSAAPPANRTEPAGKPARRRVALRERIEAPPEARTAPDVQRAPLFAGNGGVPNPQVGFLGFDTRR